jgi:hypothetical protein
MNLRVYQIFYRQIMDTQQMTVLLLAMREEVGEIKDANTKATNEKMKELKKCGKIERKQI